MTLGCSTAEKEVRVKDCKNINRLGRKLLLLILSAVVAFGLFACGEKKEYPITGSWTCDNGKIKEITLNEDGTGTIRKSSEISVSCTYSVENDKLTITTIVLNQQTYAVYTYTVTDRKLTLTDDSGSYEYTRQQ